MIPNISDRKITDTVSQKFSDNVACISENRPNVAKILHRVRFLKTRDALAKADRVGRDPRLGVAEADAEERLRRAAAVAREVRERAPVLPQRHLPR